MYFLKKGIPVLKFMYFSLFVRTSRRIAAAQRGRCFARKRVAAGTRDVLEDSTTLMLITCADNTINEKRAAYE